VCLLSNLHGHQGNYEEAAALIRRALEDYETTLGPERFDTVDAVKRLANIYRKKDKDKEADAL